MGGVSKLQIAKNSDRRVRRNNELLWSAIVEVAEAHFDDLPFGAREVLIRAGKSESSPMLTRDRGGLKRFVSDTWEEFANELQALVNRYKGEAIERSFCRDLGFLFVMYHDFIQLDIVAHSHRYIKEVLEMIEPMIDERYLLIFKAEFYQLAVLWHEDGFTRASVLEKYGNELYRLFMKYHAAWPQPNDNNHEENS